MLYVQDVLYCQGLPKPLSTDRKDVGLPCLGRPNVTGESREKGEVVSSVERGEGGRLKSSPDRARVSSPFHKVLVGVVIER